MWLDVEEQYQLFSFASEVWSTGQNIVWRMSMSPFSSVLCSFDAQNNEFVEETWMKANYQS